MARHVPERQIVQVFTEIDLLDAAIASGRGLGIQNVTLSLYTPGKLPGFEPIPELEMQHLMLISPEA